MEFPFRDMTETNGSLGTEEALSLYSRKPVLAALYVGVLGVAAVVGTLGNLVVVMTVVIKYLRNRQHRTEFTNNDSGRAFIANLALSDMIVTAIINPLAIAGWLLMIHHLTKSCILQLLILQLRSFRLTEHHIYVALICYLFIYFKFNN